MRLPCPFSDASGDCKPKPDYSPQRCSWTANGGRPECYEECFVYRMHSNPKGPDDFLKGQFGGRIVKL